MRHKFSGETCIYCENASADSSDHVVGRKFFLVQRRNNLPQVPACTRCNNRKSKLENYLMIVLAFGARHKDAAVNLETQVAHRLENKANAKLLRKLQKGYDRSGDTLIPFELKPLEEFFAMIAKALAWQHFGVRLGNSHSAIASVFSNEGREFFAQLLSGGRIHVSGDLGEGTFKYEGAQRPEYPELTVWRFEIYGGVDFGGDPKVNGPSSLAVAVTGRSELIKDLLYSGFLKDRNSPKVGRNEPCPCGSGKKHKKCHGAVAKIEARDHGRATARRVVPSTYQPLAARVY
jgi:hypothetical protein